MDTNFDYEQTIKQLDNIIETFNDGNVSLEESVKLYEEACKLIKKSKEILNNYEKRIYEVKNEQL